MKRVYPGGGCDIRWKLVEDEKAVGIFAEKDPLPDVWIEIADRVLV